MIAWTFQQGIKIRSEKYENEVTCTILFFDDVKHFETWQRFRYVQTYINCKRTKHWKIAPKLSLSKNDDICG